MTTPVFFFQSCPVCGRSLRIRVGLLGRRVSCNHCHGGFVASDAALVARLGNRPVLRPLEPLPGDGERPSDERVVELIARAGQRLAAVAPSSQGP